MGIPFCVVGPMPTEFGDEQLLFVRLNHIDGLNDHGAQAIATFRGFAGQAEYQQGKRYLWEQTVQIDADCWSAPGPVAWAVLKEYFAAQGASIVESGEL